MELVRFNPFTTAPAFNSRMNRLFDEFFETPSLRCTAKSWSPEVDIYEEGGNLVVQADLPGVEKENLSINVEKGILTLKGERKTHEKSEEKNVYRSERFHGTFERSFRLPPKTDVDKIEAEFKNGVLHVTIPKVEEPAGKEIAIH